MKKNTQYKVHRKKKSRETKISLKICKSTEKNEVEIKLVETEGKYFKNCSGDKKFSRQLGIGRSLTSTGEQDIEYYNSTEKNIGLKK